MRVPRTFVFVDLTGFTNYTAACGDDAAVKLFAEGSCGSTVRATHINTGNTAPASA